MDVTGADPDEVTRSVLTEILGIQGLVPRGLSEGNSLEEFFLRITGS
jgi:hypothetical protein